MIREVVSATDRPELEGTVPYLHPTLLDYLGIAMMASLETYLYLRSESVSAVQTYLWYRIPGTSRDDTPLQLPEVVSDTRSEGETRLHCRQSRIGHSRSLVTPSRRRLSP